MGLANRVVPVGESLTAAHDLAEQIAALPADVHARRPRLQLPPVGPPARRRAAQPRAPAAVPVIMAEGVDGAERFADGAGRHGEF